MRLLPLLLALLSPYAAAQAVFDDFADGDFSQNPPWVGDADRFAVVPFGDGFALRSDGLPQTDTLALATASTVASGRWTFRFRHEVNLSNANAARLYLIADTPDLRGDLLGYYVQFGGNNLNRIELYRQDGPTGQRVRLGFSEPVVAGDENTVEVVVTRDEAGVFVVYAYGEALFTITDATHTESTALGLWVRHSTNGRDRFFLDEIGADPDAGDVSPPRPLVATVLDDGSALAVRFDEPLDPASITTDAFAIGDRVPTATSLEAPDTVRLDFDPALAPDAYVLTVSGVADAAGNVLLGATLPFTFEPDTEPPVLVAAEALSATEVRVVFSEPVEACAPSFYEVTPDVGAPASVACPTFETAVLTLAAPFTGPATYTVTARDVPDLAGNVQPETSASFFFGTFDVPDPRDVVVNEIMHSPTDAPSNEWIELTNRTDGVFDLAEMVLANDRSVPVPLATMPTALEPGGFVVLVRNAEAFEAAFPEVPFVPMPGFPVLRNSHDSVRLLRADGTALDSVAYLASWGIPGQSIERRDPAGPSSLAANWGPTLVPGGTPGAENSIFAPDTEPPVPLSADPSNDGLTLVVGFDEPLAPETVAPEAFTVLDGPAVAAAHYEPEALDVTIVLADPLALGPGALRVEGVADFVGNVQPGVVIDFEYAPDLDPPAVLAVVPTDATTLRVAFDEPVEAKSAENASNYIVSGGIGAPAQAERIAPAEVRLTLAAPMAGPQTYALTVSGVEDLVGNAMAEQTVAFFFAEPEPIELGDLVLNEIMHSPAGTASNEWIELWNVSEKVLDLATLTLSDQGPPRPIAAEPVLLAPGDFAVLVRNPGAFAEAFPNVPFIAVPGFPTLLNGGDAVVIRREETVIDSVFYAASWGVVGSSIERRNADGPTQSPANWAASPDPRGGTPGAPNAVAPDTEPPRPLAVTPEESGLALAVTFDEPLTPATVTVSAFALSNGPTVSEAAYEPGGFRVDLTLASPLAPGEHTLTVTGVADLLGNAQPGVSVAFDFAPDLTPPSLASVVALDAQTVRVRFSEPVDSTSATVLAHYAVAPGAAPEAVAVFPEGDRRAVDLTLAAPLAERTVYTLTVSGVEDLAGNAMAAERRAFLLGEPDVPLAGDITITEVMFREAEGATEYVELLNTTADRVFDLAAMTVSDQNVTRPISDAPLLLLPGTHLALARDLTALRTVHGPDGEAVAMPTLPNLVNAGDAVVLRHGEMVLDSVFYDPAWHRPELRDARGVALERLDPTVSALDPGNWTSSLDPTGGTPGRTNSVALPPGAPPEAPGLTVSPSPFDADAGTVVRYRLASEAGHVRVRIFDAAGRLVRTLERGTLGGRAAEGELAWDGRNDRGEPLRVGIYIVLLEATDLAGGRTEAYRAPVVLARRW